MFNKIFLIMENVNTDDAVEKAGEMMMLPMNQLPELAIDFLEFLSARVGFCGEVCLTAYAAYNQMVLNMKCDDELYKITDPIYIKWWTDKGYSL